MLNICLNKTFTFKFNALQSIKIHDPKGPLLYSFSKLFYIILEVEIKKRKSGKTVNFIILSLIKAYVFV